MLEAGGFAVHDLIIVGGGPSGASAAKKASAAGLSVLLFEKEKFPRYKPCAGAVSVRALSYLGGNLPEVLIDNVVYGARVKYRDKTVEAFKQEKVALLTTRSRFDGYLLAEAQAAGTEIRVDKIVDFEEEDDHVRVICRQGKEYRAKYLIIAEGAQGNLKYKISGRNYKKRNGFALVVEIETADGLGSSFNPQLMDIQFGITRMGYGWVFPHTSYSSVGLAGMGCYMKKGRNQCLEFLQRCGFPPVSALKGHTIPIGGPRQKLVGKRTLLCGDAGGFVDSFSGEGIAYAIRSGQLAAEQIAGHLKKNRAPDLSPYERDCKQEFDENLKYSYLLLKYINKFPGLVFNIFMRDNRFLHQVLEIPLMKNTYRKIFLNLASAASIKKVN